jgi:processive 1,2-diacylglycerol beta-glucosyltransferase
MRILVATITAGGGHVAAAAALETAWRELRPKDTVECVDLIRFYSPLHRRLHLESYEQMVSRAPEIWGILFKQTDDPKLTARLNKLRGTFTGPSTRRIAAHLRDLKPDAVLCTHYLPLEVLDMLRSRGRLETFTTSIVTDFEAHALWMTPSVDLYCVAADTTRTRLVARGADPGKVAVTGIPIAAKYTNPPTSREARQRFGLRDDQPVLLVLGGGFGWGPIGEILAGLDTLEQPFQTVVVCGRNAELRAQLAVQDRKHPTHLLGFSPNMHELLAAANVVITKPGGLTTSEALAMGRPILVINPIPGQEAANSDFLLERGAAVKVNRVEDLPYRIKELLGSQKLRDMARAAKAAGKPDAATAVCREVLARMGHQPGKTLPEG